MFNLFKTYNKAKDVFVKPKLVWEFGLWRNTSGLPVWRRGPRIPVYKLFKGGFSNINNKDYSLWVSQYRWSDDFIKQHPIISKLFKPIYTLPIWLTFNVFDLDVMWKTKYDEIRFEYPPQFTIIIFGIALTVFAVAPFKDDGESYWEGLLNYVYGSKNLKQAIIDIGYYTTLNKEKGEDKSYWCIRPEYIKKEYLNEYYAATSEIKEKMFRNGQTRLPI